MGLGTKRQQFSGFRTDFAQNCRHYGSHFVKKYSKLHNLFIYVVNIHNCLNLEQNIWSRYPTTTIFKFLDRFCPNLPPLWIYKYLNVMIIIDKHVLYLIKVKLNLIIALWLLNSVENTNFYMIFIFGPNFGHIGHFVKFFCSL